ncbi:hypothetical protein IL306_000761 [Fusarium sp. DS 682]|nr:hypothetical protein IL306_000761 [Fusarium sp. DS 682]
MAPRGARRSEVAEPQAIYKLGERGRKTGVELIDTGNRDEYGMQPLDDLLSSPEKETGSDQRYDDEDEEANNDQYESEDNEDEDGSEDMDIETIPGPGPQTVLRRGMQYPIPRSRSPVKTTLLSSPRRNPNLEHLSSPTRAPFSNDRDATVTRKIDFGAKPSMRGKATTNGVNGDAHEEDTDETEDAPEPEDEGDVADDMDLLDKSLELVEDMGGHSSEPESEPEPAPVPKAPKASAKANSQRAEPEPKKPGRRGRPAKAKPVEEERVEEEPAEEEPQETEEPVKGRRGRKPKNAAQHNKSAASESRKRPAPEEPEEAEEIEEPDNKATDPEPEPEEPPRQAKRPRTEVPKPSKPAKSAPTAEPKPRGRPGRKPKAQTAENAGNDVGDTSMAAIQHRPPMPKKRGLVSVHHNPDEVKTTRSGRHSYRPLNWWAGDKVEKEEEEFKDVSGRDRFVLSTIKEIIRAPQEAPPTKPRTKARGRAKSKPVREVEVIEPEEWELNPGVVNGEVILWEPEHETNPPGDDEPVEFMEGRIAISGKAIQTRVVQNLSFPMATTLTTPFMGAGVVDLPAGSEKRPKNSRKMHMIFFVHTGKVLVTVNEASFRLSAGGMWFVPRGMSTCFPFSNLLSD